MTSSRLLALLALASPCFGAYQYYYSDTFSTINTANWTYNGSLTASANGLWSSTYGSLISKLASPTGADHEVKMTLALGSSGGYYIAFLRATPDALAAGIASGSYYAVQLLSPTYSNGACSATLQAYKAVSGAVTIFNTVTIPCHNGMTIRAVVFGSTILAFYDNIYAFAIYDTSLTSGSPGVEVFYPPAGNGISRADLGPHDYIAPNAIPRTSIGLSAVPNRVDMQWQGVTDDPNGTGILWYQIVRQDVGGVVWENSTAFSDSTVAPNTTYTYSIQAVDYHWNVAGTTVTITTPPAGSIDTREVGVRPTGIYWGGAGENIDMRSGNLNFSIPLLKVHGRGWTVPFNLSYNSQNWREDGGGDWNLGRDSGFGYGWKLQGGALLPIYSGWFTIHHYLFIDATGAEYRLDQNNSGLWSSKESIYAVYDSNQNRLYFPDGTFWELGCTSAGTEQDSGIQYPTLIEDSNGNQITLSYGWGQGVAWGNSSARLTQINDVNGGYTFYYTAESFPHLTAIRTNYPAENWNLDYFAPATLYSPFNGAAFTTTRMLSYVQNVGSSLTSTFVYGSNGAGELAQVNFPYGGYQRWVYATSRTRAPAPSAKCRPAISPCPAEPPSSVTPFIRIATRPIFSTPMLSWTTSAVRPKRLGISAPTAPSQTSASLIISPNVPGLPTPKSTTPTTIGPPTRSTAPTSLPSTKRLTPAPLRRSKTAPTRSSTNTATSPACPSMTSARPTRPPRPPASTPTRT